MKLNRVEREFMEWPQWWADQEAAPPQPGPIAEAAPAAAAKTGGHAA
ncbi:hypothetical protein OOT46_26120 [Aquabacterium sp. A7-Y]|nr:hypothetical protein [Aquabacterium sp. A7-Y]MCW7541291.1 hypothetical protein [Aquabacterium sp. A7-Y]